MLGQRLYTQRGRHHPVRLYRPAQTASIYRDRLRKLDEVCLPRRRRSPDAHARHLHRSKPRAEIDSLCDEIVRAPLEYADQSVFDALEPGDVVFCDGSHRVFENSDATVFMTEMCRNWRRRPDRNTRHILAVGLSPGVGGSLLQRAVPVACYLMGGAAQVELPIAYCSQTPALASILDPLWLLPSLADAGRGGGILWFTHRR